MVGRIGDCNCLNDYDKRMILKGLDDSIQKSKEEIEKIKESIRIGGIQFRSDEQAMDGQYTLQKQIDLVKKRVENTNVCIDE